jgi:hypothetical protein
MPEGMACYFVSRVMDFANLLGIVVRAASWKSGSPDHRETSLDTKLIEQFQ